MDDAIIKIRLKEWMMIVDYIHTSTIRAGEARNIIKLLDAIDSAEVLPIEPTIKKD